jgi:hypothetical protein
LGDILVNPLKGDGWMAESRDRGVATVDGDTARPPSAFSPDVSHIEDAGADDADKKAWSTGLTVCIT